MAIDSDYVNQMATQLATLEVQTSESRAQTRQRNYQSQLDAINSLDSALKTFRSAVRDMSGLGSSMLVNSATQSSEGYATATVDADAVAGSYEFFVEQLASRHQLALEGVGDGDIAASGSLTLGQDGNSFSIDLSAADADGDGVVSLAELSKAVNDAEDNTGVKSTLVRSNGQVSLIFAAEDSGAQNAISLSVSGVAGGAFADAVANPRELAAAQDAQVRLGGENGMLLSNASNTFEDIIDGVSLTFSKVHAAGDEPLRIDIDQDKNASKEKVQGFLDAYNTLLSTFDSLTASGSDSSARGALASDSSVRSIESMLNQVVRQDFGGTTLIDFGIQADRNGKLTLDTGRFEKALAADPEGLYKLFGDKGNLLDTLDKNVSVYSNSASGLLARRKDSLNQQISRVDDQFDVLQQRYDMYYARYLKQFTSLMQTQQSMEQTSGLFYA